MARTPATGGLAVNSTALLHSLKGSTVAWGKKAKAKQFEKSKADLKKAAEAYNKKTKAQKKADRRWGGKK